MRDSGIPAIRHSKLFAGEVNAMRKYTKPAAKEVTSGTVLKAVV